MFLVILGIIILFLLVKILSSNSGSHGGSSGTYYDDYNNSDIDSREQKQAGNIGEMIAVKDIKYVLRTDDRLFTNVRIEYNGKPAELDNVIVNKYGVFIIEVKNYAGDVYGKENDPKWIQRKTTAAGYIYEKEVTNPVRQVKRQIYILASYLRHNGANVWVRGYAIMIHGNSPVESESILKSVRDIDSVIHTTDRKMLSAESISKISKLLLK